MSRLTSTLVAEREHGSRWWSALNEMRISRELPDWLATRCAGTSADWDAYYAAQRATNLALFGTATVLTGDSMALIGCNQQVLIDTIEAERDFPLRSWTWLSDSRRQRQLPARVMNMDIGLASDMERFREKSEAVNLILFSTPYVRSATTVARSSAEQLWAALETQEAGGEA